MEETRRIGIVGRWLQHWSFLPTYAAAIVALLLILRPWHKWIEAMVQTAAPTPIGIRVHDGSEPRDTDGSVPGVGTIAVTQRSVITGADWIECDGRALSRADYPELADLVGDRFGSDAETVVLPDFSNISYWSRLTDSFSDWLWMWRKTDADLADSTWNQLHFWVKAR